MSNNGCNTTYSTEQKNYLILATGVSGIVSVVACFIAVVLILCLRLCKYFIYRLAAYQVLGSLLQSVAMSFHLMLLDYDRKNLYYKISCYFTASFVQFTMWVKLLFTIWLVFHLFLYVVFLKNVKRLEVLYLLTSTLLPLAIAAIPFIHEGYGVAGAWCYIRSWKDDCATQKFILGIVEQFVLYFGPATFFLALSIVAIVTMLAVMGYRVYRSKHVHEAERRPLNSGTKASSTSRDQHRQALKQLLPLLAYPIIYFTLLLFPVLNRIYMAASDYTNYALIMTQAVSQAVMGFFAGLVLIVHLSMLDRPRKSESGTPSNATCAGISSYTSGAQTHFSLPNESDES